MMVKRVSSTRLARGSDVVPVAYSASEVMMAPVAQPAPLSLLSKPLSFIVFLSLVCKF